MNSRNSLLLARIPCGLRKFPCAMRKNSLLMQRNRLEIVGDQRLIGIAAKILTAGREFARRRWPMRLPQIFLLRRFHRGDALQVEDVCDRGDALGDKVDAAVMADRGE